jgi:hypothetical protein
MGLRRLKKYIPGLLSTFFLTTSAFASSFVDEHSDGSLSGWTVLGARQWQEVNSLASAKAGSSSPGFLINSTTCGPDGTLEIKIQSDQWNGYNGGVVFRWTSTSSFYFVAILPGSSYSSYIKLVKNSYDPNNSSAKIVAQKFAMSGNYTLKIKMQESTFQFFINDTLRGSITDASLPSGKIGYAYSTAWNTYIYFDRIQWTETGTVPAAPTNLVATPVSPSQINLSWRDNATNETGYSIERATGSGAFSVIATLSANSTSFQSTGLTVNTSYSFRVRASNSAGYSSYSPTQTAQTFGSVKFLIIVSSPLYHTGTIASDLAQYRQDINKEGWTNKLITVNRVQDQYADLICPTEVQLKNVIKDYYKNGLQGFIVVGSPRDIPTAYWRLHEHDTTADPVDQYYADIDDWTDLDGNGVYESYHSQLENGVWVADWSNPANPNNRDLSPDLICGRVSPDTTITLLSGQAALISKYFLKIHNHRVNGSNLTPEQQARSLFLVNGAYTPNGDLWPIHMNEIENATPHINMLTGFTLLFPERIKAELRKGFAYAQITSLSGSDTLYTYSWKNEVRTPAGFTLGDLKASNAPVAQVNFVSTPNTARFTVPNFAAAFILNTDYTLNVTGSTGRDMIGISSTYYDDLNKGVPIGQAFKKLSSATSSLQGDPLLCYPRQLPNKAPIFGYQMNEATAGFPFSTDLYAFDPEDDPVSITLTGLPEGARFDGRTLTWTPPFNLAGTSDTIVEKVTDNHGNSTEQAFTLYVSHFRNGSLRFYYGETAWQSQGNGSISYGYYWSDYDNYHSNTTPYGVEGLSGLATSDTWINLRQSVQVKPNTRYRLSFWVHNQLTTNNTGAFVRVEELNKSIAVPVTTGEEFAYVKGVVNTGNRTSITVSLNNGTASSLTTGEVYFTLLRLVEGGN